MNEGECVITVNQWDAGWDSSHLKHLIGQRLIAAQVINAAQCQVVLEEQDKLHKEGKNTRFGEIAQKLGFCTEEQIESLPGFMGEKLIKAGLITQEQFEHIIAWQKKLRERGIHVRLGELTVSEGLCTKIQLEAILTEEDSGKPAD